MDLLTMRFMPRTSKGKSLLSNYSITSPKNYRPCKINYKPCKIS